MELVAGVRLAEAMSPRRAKALVRRAITALQGRSDDSAFLFFWSSLIEAKDPLSLEGLHSSLRSRMERAIERIRPGRAVQSTLSHLASEVTFDEWRDPRSIGRLYQVWNVLQRKETVWSVSRKGETAGLAMPSAVAAATQIYTDRYIADFLVANSLGRAARLTRLPWSVELLPAMDTDGRIPSVCDPACGSGHLLFSAIEAIAAHGPAMLHEFVTDRVHGFDIDETAVEITRWGILHLLRNSGMTLDANLVARIVAHVKHLEGAAGSLDASQIAGRFDVVLCNPPYAGRRKLSGELRTYLDRHYPSARHDLFAAFLLRCMALLRPGGVAAWVTMNKWLRLKGYEGLRRGGDAATGIFSHFTVDAVCDLGSRAFMGYGPLHDGVGVALTVVRNVQPLERSSTVVIDRPSGINQEPLPARFLAAFQVPEATRRVLQSDFVSRTNVRGEVYLGRTRSILSRTRPLREIAEVVVGLQTNDDRRVVKHFWEVPAEGKHWIPHSKGGGYCRWSGLQCFVLNIDAANNGFATSCHSGWKGHQKWMDRAGWVYSWFANGCLGVREKPKGQSFGRAASSGIFTDDSRVIAVLNARISSYFVRRIGGKVQLPEGVVRELPVPKDLSGIDPALIERAVGLKRKLRRGDPLDPVFSPTDLLSLDDALETEYRLLQVEELLEAAVETCFGLTEDERSAISEECGSWLRSSGGFPACGPLEAEARECAISLEEAHERLRKNDHPRRTAMRQQLLKAFLIRVKNHACEYGRRELVSAARAAVSGKEEFEKIFRGSENGMGGLPSR